MDDFIKQYLEYNQQWAQDKQEEDSEYFNLLAEGQHPKALLLGCSDSRVSPSVVIGADLGEVFVHRNIANVVAHSDLNFLSVFQYAVEVLKVEHIIVVGHYGCGGIQAAMSNNLYGLIDNWLANIKDVMTLHEAELNAIADEQQRLNRLVELNVFEQINNIRQTSVFRKAQQNGIAPKLHGWVYNFSTGLINVIFGPEINSSASRV
ncbi:MAG: carbonic anhydrase [Phaeodactylibacter sp.]|nr:carbonic anhydrase [Phaeodactylibacter sp.]MCB9302745.1 carbonic anhydrase [Lewinellaceae bacterium]HQU60433.1 carbonic anhydrase [Saprospiraceae bacterium]